MAITLVNMRDAVKEVCDLVNNPQIPDSAYNRWINDGIEKLFRIIEKVDVGSFVTTSSFTLTAATNLQAKPAGFRRLLGVSKDPTVPSQRRSLPKYNFGERDSLGTLGPRSYRVIGQNVVIEPFQLCAGNYAMYYVAGPTVLVADTDPIDVILEPYDDYVTTYVSIRTLGREESDNRDLYVELSKLEQEVIEAFAILDGDDPSTIVDDVARGPSIWTVP
jgi:hypothetical protein